MCGHRDANRTRALNISERLTQANAIDFVDDVFAKFPLRIKEIRTDTGHEAKRNSIGTLRISKSATLNQTRNTATERQELTITQIGWPGFLPVAQLQRRRGSRSATGRVGALLQLPQAAWRGRAGGRRNIARSTKRKAVTVGLNVPRGAAAYRWVSYRKGLHRVLQRLVPNRAPERTLVRGALRYGRKAGGLASLGYCRQSPAGRQLRRQR